MFTFAPSALRWNVRLGLWRFGGMCFRARDGVSQTPGRNLFSSTVRTGRLGSHHGIGLPPSTATGRARLCSPTSWFGAQGCECPALLFDRRSSAPDRIGSGGCRQFSCNCVRGASNEPQPIGLVRLCAFVRLRAYGASAECASRNVRRGMCGQNKTHIPPKHKQKPIDRNVRRRITGGRERPRRAAPPRRRSR